MSERFLIRHKYGRAPMRMYNALRNEKQYSELEPEQEAVARISKAASNLQYKLKDLAEEDVEAFIEGVVAARWRKRINPEGKNVLKE
jgi:formiminotetrahydrofolate cyclodeaminase